MITEDLDFNKMTLAEYAETLELVFWMVSSEYVNDEDPLIRDMARHVQENARKTAEAYAKQRAAKKG